MEVRRTLPTVTRGYRILQVKPVGGIQRTNSYSSLDESLLTGEKAGKIADVASPEELLEQDPASDRGTREQATSDPLTTYACGLCISLKACSCLQTD